MEKLKKNESMIKNVQSILSATPFTDCQQCRKSIAKTKRSAIDGLLFFFDEEGKKVHVYTLKKEKYSRNSYAIFHGNEKVLTATLIW